MSSRLDGRRALITGGANGLGAATAELFAAEGAKVVIADLESAADAAAKVVDRIVSAGGLAMYQPMDVRDAGLVREGIDEAAAWMGGIDSVVASAGLGGPPGQAGSFRTMLDLDVEHFDVVYDVNVRGVFLTCQRAAQLMVDAGHGGSMVTLASIAAKRPTAGAYSVSKAAVWMLTRCLAHELGPAGIRVNAIGPGYVETELFANMVRSAVGDDPAAEREWRAKRLEQVALGRYGTPLDVAQCALFLCSDESSYFTGSILHPDGGYVSTYGGG
jgi:3-oxoacyl-[acyl-carrier protein] reductase